MLNLLSALGGGFLGGIVLNAMPCVFPIVSLKVYSLLRHQQGPQAARAEGLAFLVGVLLTMLILAGLLIAARAGGASVGWGFQLQSPVVVSILALIMLAAALNLAGVFEVGLMAQRLGGADHRGGVIGAALTGALAIVVATPCSGPFMATAIGYAIVQPPLIALAIFAALALGFAAPLTAIAVFPQLARWLPRPGPWMEVLKHALAFPMFGAAAWLIWVLQQQAGSTALGVILLCALALAFAAWLYGIGQRRQLVGKPAFLQLAVAGLIVLAMIPAVNGMTRTPPAVNATAAITAPRAANAPANAAPAPASTAPLAWSPQNVAAQRGHGKALFVDFTASWCVTCQVNQRVALSTQAVQKALAQTGTIYMVADSTDYHPEIQKALDSFGRAGLPLYVLYPADGGPPKLLPQLLSPELVVKALQAAAPKDKSDRT